MCVAKKLYISSLKEAQKQINNRTKSLKDVIGGAYEQHRKRIWEQFGFKVSKDKHDAMWKVDWTVMYKGKLIAFEEDKGHYLDSCFLERALTGFSKTIVKYMKKEKEVPYFIINSFTTYSLFNNKMDEFCEILDTKVKKILKEKVIYISICKSDRINRKKWFKYNKDAYIEHLDKDLVKKDILFIKSLN